MNSSKQKHLQKEIKTMSNVDWNEVFGMIEQILRQGK